MTAATRSTCSATGTPGSSSIALIAAGLAKPKSPSSPKIRTDGGWSTGARKTMPSSGYSACSRASPPPVKNDCNVWAASWITLSPSIRPGQPRSRRGKRGRNIQSFKVASSSRLGVHDDVGDLGALPPDQLLDPARIRVCGGQRVRAEPQRQVGDEPLVRVDETELRRLDAELGTDDPAHGRGVAGHLGSGRLFAEGLEMRLYRRHLGNCPLDRPLDLLGDCVCLLERQPAGKLEMERELGAAVDREDRDVMHLPDARDVERGGVGPLAHIGVGRTCRLDVD